jgi:uncharacterized membrane protein YkvA (DUF1232 family)
MVARPQDQARFYAREGMSEESTRPRLFATLKEWSRLLKRDVHAIWLAARDPRVPWYAKALGVAVAAYALSPIDLIPDFIPVLGYLDDLILVPLGIALVVKLIPADVLAEHRAQALAVQARPVSLAGAAGVVAIWLVAIAWLGWLGYRWWIAA